MKRASKKRLLVGLGVYLLASLVLVLVMLLVPDEFDHWLRAGLAASALVSALLFMAAYQVGTRGRWRDSDIGVHLMTFAFTDAMVLLYVVLAFFGLIPLIVLPFLGALTYMTLAWLFGWRTVIMRGYMRRGKK